VLVWEERRGPRWAREDLIGRPLPWALASYLDASATFRPPRPGQDPITPRLHGPGGKQYGYTFTRAPVLLFGNWSQRETLIAIAVIALVAGGATSLGLAAYLALPIIRVQRASRALAAGALDTRVGAYVARRKDEVGA